MFSLALVITLAYCANPLQSRPIGHQIFDNYYLAKQNKVGPLVLQTDIAEIEQFLFACQSADQPHRLIYLRDAIVSLWELLDDIKIRTEDLSELNEKVGFKNSGNVDINRMITRSKTLLNEAERLYGMAKKEADVLASEYDVKDYFQNLEKCKNLLNENIDGYNMWVTLLVVE